MNEYIIDLTSVATTTMKELTDIEAFSILSGFPVLECVTRCKDCTRWSNEPQHSYEENQWCERYGTHMEPYDFCSKAQRKDAHYSII